jgi:hypothetical protein
MALTTFNVTQNSFDSHQSQPWAIVCFLRYVYPDTYHSFTTRTSANIAQALQVTRIVVVSDIVQATVSTTKTGNNNTAELILKPAQYDYSGLLSPGDHCLIWMGNDTQLFNTVSNSVLNGMPSNDITSGLKFVGKVFSSREQLTTTSTGIKIVTNNISLKAFSEFDTQIYFNPLLARATEQNDGLKFLSNISTQWNNVLLNAQNGGFPVTSIMTFFVNLFFGRGPQNSSGIPGVDRSSNYSFLVPKELAALLGKNVTDKTKPTAFCYADVLQTLFGVQKYNNGSFIPSNVTAQTATSNQKVMSNALAGTVLSPPDNFNNVSMWSLLDSHRNGSLNEMYSTLRVNENGQVVPTLVVRQVPMTSINYTGKSIATNFLEIPRWVLDETMALGSYNIGTSSNLRFNFVQVYGSFLGNRTDPQTSMRDQINAGNVAIDSLDAIRHGTRNLIMTSNNDVESPPGSGIVTNISAWKDLISDWYINGHLKLTGTVTMAGIVAPICVGDNLQYDGKVFHIESVSHTYVQEDEPQAYKSFVTSLGLSNGVLLSGDYYFTQDPRRSMQTSPNLPGYSDEEVYINNSYILNSTNANKNQT